MTINLKNIELINELYLHDMELMDIKINYFSHITEIFLNSPKDGNHVLIFKHMQSFTIEVFEPWGEGSYINEISVIAPCHGNLININNEQVITTGSFLTEILINSGDKIRILSTELIFK
jgi:hypothetical protein